MASLRRGGAASGSLWPAVEDLSPNSWIIRPTSSCWCWADIISLSSKQMPDVSQKGRGGSTLALIPRLAPTSVISRCRRPLSPVLSFFPLLLREAWTQVADGSDTSEGGFPLHTAFFFLLPGGQKGGLKSNWRLAGGERARAASRVALSDNCK